ncbi:hypothetical protein CesoFtcFv8_018672 [Champsocephalus esox]|uniref:Uncharacterized protein n=2 Tax=Champsocephalus TaxID=52236 RepID=A0AAN8D1B7_CHAGU|nr:hypothetical protein CesoFtcFv8_018672 [Champsocephalus esox]KAK5913977.1 hypothetical protein CgunFtcFv8_008451 [Champsocephalus gunnari]
MSLGPGFPSGPMQTYFFCISGGARDWRSPRLIGEPPWMPVEQSLLCHYRARPSHYGLIVATLSQPASLPH